MNKTEAIRMMLDGKKVRNYRWEKMFYAYFDRESFWVQDNSPYNINVAPEGGWEEYKEPPQYFDFNAAYKGMKNGQIWICEDSLSEIKQFHYSNDAIRYTSNGMHAEMIPRLIDSIKWYLKESE